MNVYKSKEGYYYKFYSNGTKKRISKKEYENKKQIKGGGGMIFLI